MSPILPKSNNFKLKPHDGALNLIVRASKELSAEYNTARVPGVNNCGEPQKPVAGGPKGGAPKPTPKRR
ncbi:hypothetical protein DFH09DRAFT_1360280 [Mycena vulgaris]|nr:hypothetical protein DFH09DRAFT_1360280 [Mycena vulgaris]